MKVEEQVVVIYAGTRGYLDDIPVKAIGRFEEELLRILRDKESKLLVTIRNDSELSEKSEKQLRGAIESFAKAFAV